MNYAHSYQLMQKLGLTDLVEQLQIPIATAIQQHGLSATWLELLAKLPKLDNSDADFTGNIVQVGKNSQADSALITLLQQLAPWRKGPYAIHGIFIDTEWRSDWKWQRICPYLPDLQDKLVLDVGCGNGYHCWRLAGAGAKLVIGIDPTMLSVVQFHAIQHFMGQHNLTVLPLALEQLPAQLQLFDLVLSMGVLYHRRCPLQHLMDLRANLRPGGQLILETLVVDGELGYSLLPRQRYAAMRNVWLIPACPTVQSWLERCGFKSIKLLDVTITSTEEQRSTAWMSLASLVNFLDPHDNSKTIEGYPAPKRAIFSAIRS
jgi:tRNA (mo5U34)-methyltransferase